MSHSLLSVEHQQSITPLTCMKPLQSCSSGESDFVRQVRLFGVAWWGWKGVGIGRRAERERQFMVPVGSCFPLLALSNFMLLAFILRNAATTLCYGRGWAWGKWVDHCDRGTNSSESSYINLLPTWQKSWREKGPTTPRARLSITQVLAHFSLERDRITCSPRKCCRSQHSLSHSFKNQVLLFTWRMLFEVLILINNGVLEPRMSFTMPATSFLR